MRFDVSLCVKYYNMPAEYWTIAQEALDWMSGDALCPALMETVLDALTRGDRDISLDAARSMRQRVSVLAPEKTEGVYPAVFAVALDGALARMRRAGIPEEIILDTLSDFGIWARAYEKNTGRVGFGEIGWELNFISGRILKLGRLQFECCAYHPPYTIYRQDGRLIPVPNPGVGVDENGMIAQGVPVKFTTAQRVEDGVLYYNHVDGRARITEEVRALKLSEAEAVLTTGMRSLGIHIPETGPLSDEEVEASLKKAKEFFAWMGYPCRLAACESWLLDPELRVYGEGCTNMQKFMDRFTLYTENVDGSDAVNRVYGRGTDASDPDLLPENTRLQRGLKKLLKTKPLLRDSGGVLEL